MSAAIALALSVAPSASLAERPKPAGVGIALETQRNRVKVAEMPGSTGDLMGVRAGDVITHAGGKRINNQDKFSAFVRS